MAKQKIAIAHIQERIFTIRGQQVMLDRDLAKMYQTETKYINRAVNRNPKRFPDAFAFQLSENVWDSLRFQISTLNEKPGRGQHRKYLPWVFTEQGVSMLSAVLNTDTAIQVSIQIMQAFVSMRKFMMNNASVFQRLNQVEIKQLHTDEKLNQKEHYHFGASLKDLEKKWFAFSKMEGMTENVLNNLAQENMNLL